MTRKQKWYVGIETSSGCNVYRAFRAFSDPTPESHGNHYAACIGPFTSKRGALWAVKHGAGNPHFQHVTDAERLSKLF